MFFTCPSKDNSPRIILFEMFWCGIICFDASSIPIAIHKSSNEPSFFKFAEDKFTDIPPRWNLNPLFNIALLTRSLDSLISILGSPTMSKDGMTLVIKKNFDVDNFSLYRIERSTFLKQLPNLTTYFC